MKKLYFLLILSITSFSFSQGLETFSNSNATSSYANNSFVGDNGVTWTYVASRDENADANSSGISGKALMLRRDTEPSKVTSSAVSGGIGDFSVKLYKGFTGAGNRQVELFVNGSSRGVSTPFDDFSEHIFTVTGINEPGNVVIELVNITTKQVIVDDITWTAYSGVATPSLIITSPSNATVYNPTVSSVNVSINVLNFIVANPSNGDGYITYDINNTGATNKYDTSDITVPVSPGQSYTVDLELVDNSGNSLTTPVTASVSFSLDQLYVVNDITSLRADVVTNGAGRYYQINSTPTITYARASRNQKYIQDATAAILIDDSAGRITVGAQGDGLTGLVGQTFDFNGLLEFVPAQDASVAPGSPISPQVVTIADVLATPEAYESELLQINGVTFDATNTTFATNTNVPVTAPTATTFRPIFSEADYIGQNIPTSATNIICFAGQSTPTNVPTTNEVYFVARSLADLTLETKSFNAIDGLKMYPNPLTGNTLNFSSNANAAMTVQVYDVLGKEVVKGNVTNNTFNTGNLRAGIYIVKITEEGKTATRKLVVK